MKDDNKSRVRAWDLINNEMHYDFQRMYIKSGNEDEIPSGIIFQSDIYQHDFSHWPPLPPDKIRELYTMEWVHAVDEMGMPIYESDILKIEDEDGKEHIGVVWWGTKGCAIIWDIDCIRDSDIDECGKTLYVPYYFDSGKKKFSIIGNIYENKELVSNLIEIGILKYPKYDND